jgi:hypothetical protein
MYQNIFYIGSVIYVFSYYITNYFLNNNSRLSLKYNMISFQRKLYICSNIIKSIFLCILSINYIILLIKNKTLFLNWKNEEFSIKSSVILYMIPDFWSMIITNSTMMMTTIFHHLCVLIATVFIINSDIETDGIHISFIYYGLLSSFSFLVNTFLGMRFLVKFTKKQQKFIIINYILICLFNWTWQIYYLLNINEIYIYKFILILLLYFWINDDIVLLKFLKNYNEKYIL